MRRKPRSRRRVSRCCAAGCACFVRVLAALGENPESATSRGTRSIFGFQAAELTDPLVTDRPDFTESPDAVPFGRVQWEGGYTFVFDREGEDRVRDHTAPETLIRVGVSKNTEVRLGLDGYSWTESLTANSRQMGRRVTYRDEWSQGANDMTFGFKTHLFDQEGLIPSFGIIGQITVPSGSASYSAGDVDPEAKLCWSYDLTDRVSLSGNVNVASVTSDAERFAQAAVSVSLGASLTDRWGVYAEYFGLYPNADDADCAHSLNGGFTFLATKNLQFDARIGAGLNEEADDFFTGVGFAVRF